MKWFLVNPVFHGVVYVILRVLIFFIEQLSPGGARRMAVVIGRVVHALDRKHREIGRSNLRAAEPPVCTPEEVPAMVRRIYEHLGQSFVEFLRVPRLAAGGKLFENVRMEGMEALDGRLRSGRGVIVVIAHLGNWEVCGVALSLAGYAIHSLARPLSNPFIDRYLNRFRGSGGQDIIPKYNALKAMVEVVERGEMLIIQGDQDARKNGVFPTFFGRPASTHRSPAVLALRHDIPIFPGEIFRENGRHVMRPHDPLMPADFRDAEDPVLALTQAYTSKLEEYLRRPPDQWMWLHRRWKTKPERARRVRATAEA
ncbi:MAG: lysophospholipid acyltransferase family protein [Planctomycetota bacterium]|jgi:KDO2-lipid IV(A) lauroyltransferase